MKLFGFLLGFTFIILAVVWVLQIGLLSQFYEHTKYDELERADNAITTVLKDNVGASEDELGDAITRYATDYLICARIFRVEDTTAIQIASADVSADCIIHRMSHVHLTQLYYKAHDNDGLFVRQYTTGGKRYQFWMGLGGENLPSLFPPEGETDPPEDMLPESGFSPVPDLPVVPELPADGAETRGEDDLHKTWGGTEGASINTVYVRLVEDVDGNEYIIMLNSEMAPLSTTVQMLKSQFWMIAVILLVCALALSIVISKHISKPIVQMNESAKLLPTGKYNADFGAQGYREVIELSDTLASAAEELSKNDKLQKELIANITHDLRTPLTMIKGYSEVMRDIPGENTPENIQVVIDETERLSELVNDLLDLSKLQAGTRKPEPQIIDLTELICSTLFRYEKLTKHEGYSIEYRFGKHVLVEADKTMLLQVIYNLINNAINYTGDDKRVSVRQTVFGNKGRVRISVTDSGDGIAPDMIPLIWDRYYKVDKVHRRAMVGTGLGLSIVKSILEQHGAEYGVDSKLGEGSTFWFELDIYSSDGNPRDPIDAEFIE